MFVYYNHRFAKLFGTGVLLALLTAITLACITAGTFWIAATNSTGVAIVFLLVFITAPGLFLMGLLTRTLYHMAQSWQTSTQRESRGTIHTHGIPPEAHHVTS